MEMPGRDTVFKNGYRYGFNGKEIDNIPYGQGNAYDYGMRIYNPRVGRFLSVDPLIGRYPYFSAYQYAGGNPIAATDVDGKEPDWLTWKLVLWFTGVKLKGSDAGNNFVKNLNTVATSNNMGHFDSNDPATLQQEVDNKNKNTLEAKMNAYKSVVNTTTYATIGATTPFVLAAAAPVLPELFTVSGTSELTATGSYLLRHTIEAFADAGGQKIITGKVDWFDVATDYLPAKGAIGKVLLGALQSSVDYSGGKFKTIFDNKSLSDASLDAGASALVGVLFGKFDKELEKAFKAKGFKGDKLTAAIGSVIKAQKDYIESALKTSLAETAKDKLKK